MRQSAAADFKPNTLVQLRAYYVPRRFRVRVINVLLMRGMMRKRARLTLQGLKRLVEGER